MTMMRTSLIAAFGLFVAGSLMPSPAGAFVARAPIVEQGEAVGLQLITDRHRGSWKRKKSHHYGREYSRHRNHVYHGDPIPGYGKHFKKKKRRHFKRGYRRGFDDGYYEGRRHAFKERRYRRHRDYGPRYGFRGGFFFGDDFRFRY